MNDISILARHIRAGQEVAIHAFPAGRVGAVEEVEGVPRSLGADVAGKVNRVIPSTLLVGPDDAPHEVPGVRITFDDGSEWEALDRVSATWRDGPKPTDEQITETIQYVEEARAYREEQDAAWDAYGVFARVEMHPGIDEDQGGEPALIVHLPGDDYGSGATPEEAEAFALQLLREAAVVRLMREAKAQHDAEHHHHHG